MGFSLTAWVQTIELRSNGFVSQFTPIDSLHYVEYSIEGKSVSDLKKVDPSTLILNYTFGRSTKAKPDTKDAGFIYSTTYFAYSDGTLQAPTTQIFFKPSGDINQFKAKNENIGTVIKHPFLEGYYFLNIRAKEWLSGEKIFALCNQLFDSQMAEVAEPVFIRQVKTTNPLRPWQWNIRNNANVPGGVVGSDMGVEAAWNLGSTGAGVRVAVIDDGVDLTHPDLARSGYMMEPEISKNNCGMFPVPARRK